MTLGLTLSLVAQSMDATPGGGADALLLEDDVSGYLLEDGTSYYLMESAP